LGTVRNGAVLKSDGITTKLKEYIAEDDPFLYKKMIVSYIFHEPIMGLEDKMSAYDIDKYYTAALVIIDSILFAPFKRN
jgi:hypothetical protein